MAVFYTEEEGIWKCRRHPTSRRTSGVCPLCLRDRLIKLCPECANVRPCACCPTSSSSSSSSSFSLPYSADLPKHGAEIGATGRISNFIKSEHTFRRSGSAAFPFLRRNVGDKEAGARLQPTENGSKTLLRSVFNVNKLKKGDEVRKDESYEEGVKRITRSNSVGISGFLDSIGNVALKGKGKGWHFPSPMKVFRQPKTARLARENSPLYRS